MCAKPGSGFFTREGEQRLARRVRTPKIFTGTGCTLSAVRWRRYGPGIAVVGETVNARRHGFRRRWRRRTSAGSGEAHWSGTSFPRVVVVYRLPDPSSGKIMEQAHTRLIAQLNERISRDNTPLYMKFRPDEAMPCAAVFLSTVIFCPANAIQPAYWRLGHHGTKRCRRRKKRVLSRAPALRTQINNIFEYS